MIRSFVLMGQRFSVEPTELAANIHSASGPSAHADGNLTALGITEVARQRIGIRAGQGFHQERSTVIHEVIHAIERLTGHEPDSWSGDDGKARHALIGALETGLLDLLRSNPDLVAYLTEPEA